MWTTPNFQHSIQCDSIRDLFAMVKISNPFQGLYKWPPTTRGWKGHGGKITWFIVSSLSNPAWCHGNLRYPQSYPPKATPGLIKGLLTHCFPLIRPAIFRGDGIPMSGDSPTSPNQGSGCEASQPRAPSWRRLPYLLPPHPTQGTTSSPGLLFFWGDFFFWSRKKKKQLGGPKGV